MSPGKRSNLSQCGTTEPTVKVCNTELSPTAGSKSFGFWFFFGSFFGSVSCSHLAAVLPGKPWRLIQSANYSVINFCFIDLVPFSALLKFRCVHSTYCQVQHFFVQYLISFQYLAWITFSSLCWESGSEQVICLCLGAYTLIFCIYYVNNDSFSWSHKCSLDCSGDSSQYVTQKENAHENWERKY